MPDQHPGFGPVPIGGGVKEKLYAIQRLDLEHVEAAKFRGLRFDPSHGFVFDFVGQVKVGTRVVMLAVFLLQVVHQLPERLAFVSHDVGQQQRVQDAVALGQVAANADAA